MSGVAQLHQSSWPGVSRPSTRFVRSIQDVDARDKPEHDVGSERVVAQVTR
jgi:hypothetical protein